MWRKCFKVVVGIEYRERGREREREKNVKKQREKNIKKQREKKEVFFFFFGKRYETT